MGDRYGMPGMLVRKRIGVDDYWRQPQTVSRVVIC